MSQSFDFQKRGGYPPRRIKVRIRPLYKPKWVRRFSLDADLLEPLPLEWAIDMANELLNIAWSLRRDLILGSVTTFAMILMLFNSLEKPAPPIPEQPQVEWKPPPPAPLVMKGGDPYIRALMRTISASESNVEYPYSVLYGGKYVQDLKRHPDICVTIVVGPNKGDCTTAAGRYQMLSETWAIKSELYHPQTPESGDPHSYNFEAKFQDEVVYNWLSDDKAWGNVDLPDLLRQNRLTDVLKILSSTWTSLGYGIETNSMSKYLPEIYQEVLGEECSVTDAGCSVAESELSEPVPEVSP